MKHRLLSPLAALALLGCATILVLWIDIYYAFNIASSDGHLSVLAIEKNDDGRQYMQLAFADEKWDTITAYDDLRSALASKSDFKGAWGPCSAFGFEASGGATYSFNLSIDPRLNFRYFLASVPYWLVFLVSAALAIILVAMSRRQNRRLHPMLCAKCGYDLRATPDQCPECGDLPMKNQSIIN